MKEFGFVYFIEAVGCNRVKIGHTTNLLIRLKKLQQHAPFELKVLLSIRLKSGIFQGGNFSLEELETELHERFREFRIIGEWFHLSGVILQFIEEFKSGKVTLPSRQKRFTITD